MLYNLPVDYDKLNRDERMAVRDLYVLVQNGKCYFCEHELNGPPGPKAADRNVNFRLFPDGFFTRPVHLHHNHDTGLTIGAVHARCNAVLWQHYGE